MSSCLCAAQSAVRPVLNAVRWRSLPAGETQLVCPLVDMSRKYNLYTSAEYDLVPDFLNTHRQRRHLIQT